MKKEKSTLRQLQAEKSKQKLYKAAVSLFDKHGFENTSIEDICIKAGLSVGAFYYYYSSKSDIYCELHSKIDEYYKKNVQDKLNSEDFYDNIILYFKHYADFINMKGFDAVKQLFNKNKFFCDKFLYTYKMLNGIIKMGKEKKQLAEDRDINEIEDLLIIIATGVVCDWVIHGGDYDLSDKMVKFISVLRPVIEK